MASVSGSSGRPPANSALRGALLIVLAVVIGIALMSWGFADEGGLIASGETTEPAATEEPVDPGDDGGVVTDPNDGTQTETTEPEEAVAPPRDQSEITVLVLNGSGVDGAAGRVNNRLAPLNYIMRPPGNTRAADGAPERVAETRIYYIEGSRPEALRLAGELNISEPGDVVEVMPIPAPHGAELGEATSLLVVLGEDELIAATAN